MLAKHPSSTQDRGHLNPQNNQRKKHPIPTLQPTDGYGDRSGNPKHSRYRPQSPFKEEERWQEKP